MAGARSFRRRRTSASRAYQPSARYTIVAISLEQYTSTRKGGLDAVSRLKISTIFTILQTSIVLFSFITLIVNKNVRAGTMQTLPEGESAQNAPICKDLTM
jgi:hypothetical protein